jgi:hypothetical protein
MSALRPDKRHQITDIRRTLPWGQPARQSQSALSHAIRGLDAARAINWARDPFSGRAYSFATPKTREAQSVLASSDAGAVLLSGEALYRGRDMGTVEAALTSAQHTAQTILAP